MTELPLETNCRDVQQLLGTEGELLLLDCRETTEHEIGVIDGSYLLPMSELATRQEELADRRESHIVVYCHHGMRSAQVATWLRQQGFSRAQSLAGGIDRWSTEIDPSLPRY